MRRALKACLWAGLVAWTVMASSDRRQKRAGKRELEKVKHEGEYVFPAVREQMFDAEASIGDDTDEQENDANADAGCDGSRLGGGATSGGHRPQVIRRAQSALLLHRATGRRHDQMIEKFLTSTAFIHGDTFLKLGRTTSGILFGYLATIYCVFILSTTLLLYQRRKDPSLAKIPLWLSHFIPAGLNGLIVTLGFVRHMFRARYPCFVVLWTYGLLAPMYVVMTFEARSLNLIFEYHWNKRMQALLQAAESRHSDNLAVVLTDKSPPDLDPKQLRYREDWYWIKKHGMVATILCILVVQFCMILAIQVLSPYYRIWPEMDVYRCAGELEVFLPLASLGLYMFVIPLYLLIQLRRINDSYGVRQDIFAAVTQSAWITVLFTILRNVYFIEHFVGYIPSGFSLLIGFGNLHYHMVCAPLLRIYMWQWNRSHAKRRVRRFSVLRRSVTAWLFPRLLRIRPERVSGGARERERERRKREMEESQTTFPLSHAGIKAPQPMKAVNVVDGGVSVSMPKNTQRVFRSMDSRATGSPMSSLPEAISPAASTSPFLSPDLQPPTFNQVLQDEALCELFERYTLLEFSRENLLFYRAVCSLRTTYTMLPPAAAHIFLVEKSRSLAAQFIQANAPAEINIPGPIRQRIETRILELDIDLTLFDEAQREVFRLMQNWSFPRFLRTIHETEIRRFNRKTRRNSTSAGNGGDGASRMENALTSAPVPSYTATAARPIPMHPSAYGRRPLAHQDQSPFSAQSRLSESFGSTSVLAMPLHIAHVSLSSSP